MEGANENNSEGAHSRSEVPLLGALLIKLLNIHLSICVRTSHSAPHSQKCNLKFLRSPFFVSFFITNHPFSFKFVIVSLVFIYLSKLLFLCFVRRFKGYQFIRG